MENIGCIRENQTGKAGYDKKRQMEITSSLQADIHRILVSSKREDVVQEIKLKAISTECNKEIDSVGAGEFAPASSLAAHWKAADGEV